MDERERTDLALEAAEAGAAVAEESFRTEIDVEQKDNKADLVTQVDRDAQRRVVAVIHESYPDEPIVGEEDEERGAVPEEGPAWIVDPVDGTSNYVRGVQVFGTCIAAVVDGEPVGASCVFPALEDRYRVGPDGATRNGEPIAVSERSDPDACVVSPTLWWDFDDRAAFTAAAREVVERFGDMRRYGSAQATLALVATGGLEAAISEHRGYPWDTVAGVHLIREAGGKVTDLDGNRWRHDSVGLVASNGHVHDEALAAARGIEG